MRIALLSYSWGEYCIRLAGALSERGDTCLCIPRELAQPHLPKLNPAVHLYAFEKPRLRQPWRQWATIATLLGTLRNFRPDVIHIQHGHLWLNMALPLLPRAPVVITIHDPRHHLGDRRSQKTPQFVYDFGFRRAQEVIVHAQEMAKIVVNEIGIVRDKVHVIPHILLGEESAPTDARQHAVTVLFFGRIWPYKGLEHLIRAEPSITSRVPEARIVIAGAGEDFGRYRAMMANPDRFIVHNEYISHEKRTQLFEEASVVVLPYIEATQSGVIPLAYASGKPVVATTVGGLPEMVDDGRTGYLVPPGDEEALADTVADLLQNEERRRQFGSAGRKKLYDLCSPHVVAEQTLAVYEQALKS